MIDNRVLSPDEWQCVWYVIVTILFALGVLFKMLSDSLRKKTAQLQREHGLLKPCPFCNGIPKVKNGYFYCKNCRLTMIIPFRHYKSVQDMVDQTWNRRNEQC